MVARHEHEIERVVELPHPKSGERRAVAAQTEVTDVPFLSRQFHRLQRAGQLGLVDGTSNPEKVDVDSLATDRGERLDEVGLDQVHRVPVVGGALIS